MKNLEKTALVTGASRGIGRAIAKRLAQDGFYVIVNYSGSTQLADDLVQEIIDDGGLASAIQANIADENEVRHLFSKIKTLTGQLDVVVHNAGIMPLAKISPLSLSDFDDVIHTNLRGSFLVLAHAAECLEDGGRIIAVSSSVIQKSFPSYGPYIASKLGVEGLVHVLANELRGRNITVNAVAPGPVATELFFKGKSAQQISTISKLSPLERIAVPEEIANVVSMLSGNDGSWINCKRPLKPTFSNACILR
ncbi:MAG: SDR family oxidoreductase [Acinetobacter populi]|uniref:SDR family oxidoreductase n=1 Tax=Acinetobacter populi TaxID=1582270 RepID=UPI00235711ED|nr:SDR family oxidoreductase [Acinetobacter populi]MCH4249204.1 SDR family oxidoreductase [Acinetobacter populi]